MLASLDLASTCSQADKWNRTPSTQTAVAMAFMKERGCVVTRYRRNYAAGRCVFEDAMIEYHALREKG